MTPRPIMVAHAVGDAAAKPFEQEPGARNVPHPLKERWVRGELPFYLPGTYAGLGPRGKPAGAFTDDTQMAVALAASLIARGDYNPHVCLQDYYLPWFQGAAFTGPPRGIGGTVRAALQRYLDHPGYAPEGEPLGGAGLYVGNGTAMRATPLGIYFREDLDVLFDAAAADARITHNHPEAVAGSCAVAAGVALHLLHAPGRCSLRDYYGRLLEELATRGHYHTAVYAKLAHVAATAGLVCAPVNTLGNGGYVADTVATAFAAHNRGSAWATLAAAVEFNGDTDTRAAIACALAAAAGEPLPDTWYEGLEARAELQQLDKDLLREPRDPASIAP